MPFSQELSNNISKYFKLVLDNTIQKTFADEPYDIQKELSSNPFNTRLLPPKIWKSSIIERSFVNSMGNAVYEEITKLIGENIWGTAALGENTEITIYQSQLNKIHKILDELDPKLQIGDKNLRDYNWDKEINQLVLLKHGDKITSTVISDVFLYNPRNNEMAFIELKSREPNKDQYRVSKEKMLKLFCHFKNGGTFEKVKILFALPFNPYHGREEYDHSFLKIYFDMKSWSEVKIGAEFWNFVGKNENTYTNLLDIATQIGEEYKDKVNKLLNGI